MTKRKGGRRLDDCNRKKRQLADFRTRFAPKIGYRISQAILELLDEYYDLYSDGITTERIPNKIRNALPIYPVMRESEIIRYTKTSLFDLKLCGLVERIEYAYYSKSEVVRLKKSEGE